MGSYFNKHIMNTNKVRGKAKFSSPLEEARRLFNEQNLHSEGQGTEVPVHAAGRDEEKPLNDNPTVQDGQGGARRTRKGATGKKRRKRRVSTK